jgi:PEP-CTERM motif
MRNLTRGLVLVLSAQGLISGASAEAGLIPYPATGSVAPTTHLMGTGTEIIAYFGGSGAAFLEQVGLYVNGVLTPAGFIFPNGATSVGVSVDLGFAPAGSDIVFALQVYDTTLGGFPTGLTTADTGILHYSGPPTYTLYSVPGDAGIGPGGPYDFSNPDGSNHAYITSYSPGQIPVISVGGTYVGFEDLLADGSSGSPSDLNYTDEQFVFTGVAVASTVPEPSSLALCGIAGAIGLAGARLRRKRA